MTRGHNIVADRWAGASNPHPHPNPTPTLKHTQKLSTEEGLTRCEPPKTVAPPPTGQTIAIYSLCWDANYSLGLYK